jgi:hypothetical protein
MLELSDATSISLNKDVAEELGVNVRSTVGEIRDLIKPQEPKQVKMVEIEDDFNMEL